MNDTAGISKTRYKELGYRNDGPGLWRFYALEDGCASCVGPLYKTKAELLADLERYASEYGCEGGAPRPTRLFEAAPDMERVLEAIYEFWKEGGSTPLSPYALLLDSDEVPLVDEVGAVLAKARGEKYVPLGVPERDRRSRS